MESQRAAPVLVAMLLWAVSAPESLADLGAAQRRAHAAGGHSHDRTAVPYRARVVRRTASWAAPVAYAPAAYYAPTYAPPRAGPGLYFVAPISANAPLFSFDGSPALEPDWGWQRVSLPQLAAEVRAKREPGKKP